MPDVVTAESAHELEWIVWDGRQVAAEFRGPEAKAAARGRVDELRDAGNPDVRLWQQRRCAWVNTTVRADPRHMEALDVGGATLLAYSRRLGQLEHLHAPAGSRCRIDGEPYPCQTIRLVTAPIDP